VGNKRRRVDIADNRPEALHGIEVKSYETGKVYATEDIRNEVGLDKYLVEQGWKMEWVFKGCEPSTPLKQLLEEANIKIRIID